MNFKIPFFSMEPQPLVG